MSIIGSNVLAGASGSGVEAYQIEQSLRFDGSSGYLSRTHSNNNASSDFTLSMWFKKAYNGDNNMMLIHTNPGSNYSYVSFGESTNDADLLTARGTSSGYAFNTSRKYRDNSAWYHIVLSVDAGTLTEAYVNGVLDQNTGATSNWYFNSNQAQAIGRQAGSAADYFSGYIAEVHFIDGQALDADNFGEFHNGVWRPIEYTGTYGDNGYYLKFDPDATNGVGHDHSGNGNNWTASGFTTSGSGTDVMSDTPTTNWATLNPIGSTATGGFSEGNLKYLNGTTAVWRSALSTFAVSSGKWYAEVSFTGLGASGTGFVVGISPTSSNVVGVTNHLGQSQIADSIGYYHQGTLYINGSGSSYGASYTNNDVLGIALDLDGGTLHFYKNGVDQGEAASSLTGSWYMGISSKDTTATFNFGQRAFEQTVPTGYKALNTSNLPTPDIKDGSDHFNTVTYTGTGATQTVTGVGFQPDFVWAKSRTNAYSHQLYDAVRGAGKVLVSNSTGTENTVTYLNAFTSDGFTLDGDAGINEVNDAHVAWNWKAGGSTSSNTDGSVTSTVSANPSAGFSIVSYTGNGTSGATVGHGLGVAASMLIVKNRDRSDSGIRWAVYHQETGNTDVLYLNETNAAAASSAFWNDTTPTSTVFTIGTDNDVNTSGDDYIAYCFAEVEGYSKFGSYTGNGSSNGPFVATSFLPAWIMTKNSSTGGAGYDWYIFDSERNTYNPVGVRVKANASDAETSTTAIDLLSNGFKIRTSDSSWNRSGDTFVYMCFASNPFGGDGVSPATAR